MIASKEVPGDGGDTIFYGKKKLQKIYSQKSYYKIYSKKFIVKNVTKNFIVTFFNYKFEK